MYANINILFVSELDNLLQKYRAPLETRIEDVSALYNSYEELLRNYGYYLLPQQNIVNRFRASVFGSTRKKRASLLRSTKKNYTSRENSNHDENKNPNFGGRMKRKNIIHQPRVRSARVRSARVRPARVRPPQSRVRPQPRVRRK